ncbi:MAG: hypothetical protein ACREEM_19135 [Blastocatellia bacterium]
MSLSSGATESFRIKLLPYAAPALLVAVAFLHVYLVFSSRLSPWKGGGFGMFSTVRSPASRVLRIYLVTEKERIPILLPAEFRDLEREIRTMPTQGRARDLAAVLCKEVWAPYQLVPAEEHYRNLRKQYYESRGDPAGLSGPDPGVNRYSVESRAYLDRLLERLRILRRVPRSERHSHGAVPFLRVEVEVWELDFDHAKSLLRVQPLLKEWANRHE